MKPFYYFTLAIFIFILASCSHYRGSFSTKSFIVSLEEVKDKYHFPNLQSFVLAESSDANQWLIIGGRTNGMHNFGGDNYEEKSFPIRNFNDTIWVYDYAQDKRYSYPVDRIKAPGSLLFKATNLQSFQDKNYLYLTGGYGENDSIPYENLFERYETYADIARIDVEGLISSIVHKASDEEVNQNIIYGYDEAARATGGELYKLDDYFYLAGGHVYKGMFSIKKDNTITPTSQEYLNSIHRFQLSESDNRLELTNYTKISDGFADDSTQFRRRDLPVTPSVYLDTHDKWEEGLAMYAGVFTSPDNKIKSVDPNGSWKWPIYIYKNGTYLIDSSFEQYANFYSAPSFVVVDSNTNTVYTTIIGGIGSENKDVFTNRISTITRTFNKNQSTYSTMAQPPIPSENFFGAEAFMVLHPKNRLEGATLDVFDITKLKRNEEIEIGVFCGGIESFVNNPGGYGKGKSQASNKIWKVKLRIN